MAGRVRKVINVPVFLIISIGTIFLLQGFGVIKNDWKSEAAKVKGERLLKAGGLIMIVAGIIRLIYWLKYHY
jgi:hypothetical protein